MATQKPPAPKPARKTPARSKPAAAARPLNLQQLKFVEIYTAAGEKNATGAYRDAGYKIKSDKVAGAAAARLLADVRIRAAIEATRKRALATLDISKDRILNELAAMGFYDPADLVIPDPKKPGSFVNIDSPADIRKLPERVRRCIIGWSYDRGGRFILKLANKQSSLELLGRHLAMWVDRKEVRIGDLSKATDAELDAKIAQAAQRIAESEGRPVDEILGEVRAALSKASESSKAALDQVG